MSQRALSSPALPDFDLIPLDKTEPRISPRRPSILRWDVFAIENDGEAYT